MSETNRKEKPNPPSFHLQQHRTPETKVFFFFGLIIYEPAWEKRKKWARDGNKVRFIAGGLTSPKI